MTKVQMMTPAQVLGWIHGNGGDISSFARMMKMHRRTLQRILEKHRFNEWDGFLFTMFCKAFDEGYHVEGMDMPGFRRKGKLLLRRRDLNPRPFGYEPNELANCSTAPANNRKFG